MKRKDKIPLEHLAHILFFFLRLSSSRFSFLSSSLSFLFITVQCFSHRDHSSYHTLRF
jgi:hypothetical protein